MTSAQIATLAASMNHIVADDADTVLLSEVLRQRRLFARMIEAAQGNPPLQKLLDDATLTAAHGCSAPMAKVLELDSSDDSLIIKSQYGLAIDVLGQRAGRAVSGNPPGEALKAAAPVVDSDVRKRPPELLPKVFKDNHVVTSVNLPLINHDGPYGVLEVDFHQVTAVGALHISFLASVAGALAENIEQTQARAALAAERDAKALLLREQQHRIRNNFQLIIAMVQRSVFKANDNDDRKSLRAIERRLFAMASIYDHLLGLSEQSEFTDLGRYLGTMAANFDDLYDLKDRSISLRIDLQFGIVVDIETCTTVGTVVNELVANSVEHAFADAGGQITVSLNRFAQHECVVCVEDNGRGLGKSMLEESTGLRTVRHMLGAIGGQLDLEAGSQRGMKWLLRFSDGAVRQSRSPTYPRQPIT
ncbi:GAF domain-containing protein [Paraburkholderia sp. LEh10]|uniref:sensor histidine kinase n=1 Tax=Paraburkholderia sp. LEh10 TaxID=2821353 RepID=UPI001AE6B7EA|nr:histidine kinase dimerization/phosphoacceptor domain -containing protein [Paraburkholderia sp. LEh10]MBP0588382.1 GAF domain-containing protein [Paraburkholderia sp. LEh10]